MDLQVGRAALLLRTLEIIIIIIILLARSILKHQAIFF
jgi:hypothetical protein